MTMDKLLKSHQLLERQNAGLLSEITFLKQELSELRRFIFGQKSERFVPTNQDGQLGLDLGDRPVEIETTTEHIGYERKKSNAKHTPHGRMELPAHLERHDTIIEPEEETAGLKKIGEEITEELEYEPGKLFVNRFIRPKYARANREGIIIGSLPTRPIEKGIAGPGLLSHILISKFVDHLPIYRQIQIFKRENIKIPKSTIDGWITAVCELLSPLNEAHRKLLLQTDYLLVDETPVRVLDKRKKGKTHQGYFWVYYDPLRKLVFFDYRSGRDGDAPKEVLKGYKGAVQTDGYAGYNGLFDRRDIIELACMAHARRYFEKALNQDKDRAEWMLSKIQLLYKVEAEARDNNFSHEQRYALRKEKSAPVLRDIKIWLDENLIEVLPKSLTGKAISYMLGRWKALARYLDDGRYEIDNNLVENAIRPVALGRKNYLFAGSHNGARRMAQVYSLVATARMQGIGPMAYLKETLTKLPDWPVKKVEELLPIRNSPEQI